MEELDTSGFYKELNGLWYYAPSFVYSKNYTLERGGNQQSIDGWEWHDAAPQAYLDWEKVQETLITPQL